MKLLKNKDILYVVFEPNKENSELRIMKIENNKISWMLENEDNWKELDEAIEI